MYVDIEFMFNCRTLKIKISYENITNIGDAAMSAIEKIKDHDYLKKKKFKKINDKIYARSFKNAIILEKVLGQLIYIETQTHINAVVDCFIETDNRIKYRKK